MGAGKCFASRSSFAHWTSENEPVQVASDTCSLKSKGFPIAVDGENQDTWEVTQFGRRATRSLI